VAPTSVWFTKQWPAEKWIELIQSIQHKVKSIFLLGAPADHHVCESIRLASGFSGAINLAGKLSFLESAALMKNAEMNFVNDSAPMHLASAMNAPVI
jgi:heptosyltransferase II